MYLSLSHYVKFYNPFCQQGLQPCWIEVNGQIHERNSKYSEQWKFRIAFICLSVLAQMADHFWGLHLCISNQWGRCFCFVLFCFVLFCFVLFCFVLFCFVLFCFVFHFTTTQAKLIPTQNHRQQIICVSGRPWFDTVRKLRSAAWMAQSFGSAERSWKWAPNRKIINIW